MTHINQFDAVARTTNPRRKFLISIFRNWELYLMFLPVLLYYLLFKYAPMYGVQLAFKKFSATAGIWGSPWIGLENFIRFFNGVYFRQIVFNTITISLFSLAVGFPSPILLALMLNEVKSSKFKKTVQTITYAPHFISTVVMCGMIILFLSQTGVIGKLTELIGGESINYLYKGQYFKTVYVLSGVWQGTGWGSVIYIAALSGVDPQLHESAVIDGATRLQRIWHINVPGILPTMSILFILNTGSIMSVGFEKVFLLMNDLNRSHAEVISTYTYKIGLIQNDFSFSTAIGLFNSVINMTLLLIVNSIIKKLNQSSLF
jgi:putative aldouronate transport system permease protein